MRSLRGNFGRPGAFARRVYDKAEEALSMIFVNGSGSLFSDDGVAVGTRRIPWRLISVERLRPTPMIPQFIRGPLRLPRMNYRWIPDQEEEEQICVPPKCCIIWTRSVGPRSVLVRNRSTAFPTAEQNLRFQRNTATTIKASRFVRSSRIVRFCRSKASGSE